MEKTPSASGNKNDAPMTSTPSSRIPLSPRCPGWSENVAHHAQTDSPGHHDIRPQSAPYSSTAEAVYFDPLQNSYGFPVVNCVILGKKHSATFAPTPAHRNALGYLVQIKNEGNTHREAGMDSFMAMQKMEMDEKRREAMTASIIQKGVANLAEAERKPAAFIQKSKIIGLSTDNSDSTRASFRDVRRGSEMKIEGVTRRSRDRGGMSRMCRNSYVPGSSSFISEALTNMMSRAETEPQCSYPFREQFETLWTASHMGRSMAPEALSSKRSRGCLQSNDSVP